MRASLLEDLLDAINRIPKEEWEGAALRFERPRMKDRAVSMSFIHAFVGSLKAVFPDYARLNSYMVRIVVNVLKTFLDDSS